MQKILIFAAPVLFGVLFYALHFSAEYYRNKMLREKVAFVATERIWEWVANNQIKLSIPKEYSIIGEKEWEFAKAILQSYAKDLQISYITDKLLTTKQICSMSSQIYLQFTLCSYLSKHQGDRVFLDHDMLGQTIEREEYGGVTWNATYTLTDFSVVYHKLYYASYIYCKGNKLINPKGDLYQNDGFIKNILDTHQIEFSKM